MKKIMNSMKAKSIALYCKSTAVLKEKYGSGYIDVAVVILIAVVLGALLLGGLYALFGDLVLPTLTRKIQEMFNYAG